MVGIDAKIQARNRAGALFLPIKEMLAIIGRMLAVFVKVIPNIKSFQDQVNWDRNTMERGAFAMGTKISVRIRQLDAPSIFADSQISLEIPRKKFLNTNMQNGMQIAV